jgi:hypothetical protein
VDAKTADKGVDFAYLVDKSGFAEGGQGTPMTVAPGTFLEFKRMARVDLGGKQIKPPTEYKARDDIGTIRKRQGQTDPSQPQASGTPGAPAAAPGEDLKNKLVGNWAGTSDTGQLIIEFRADGTLTFNNTPRGGVPQIGQGTWQVIQEKTTADTLVINRTVNQTSAENTIKFTDDNNMTLTSAGRPPLQLQKR